MTPWQPIYTVTVIWPAQGPGLPRNQRCVGWWPMLEGAIRAIRRNDGDMFESHNAFAVIESPKPYVYCSVTGEEQGMWFAWDGHVARSIETPEWAQGTVNWGIG